ncbi:unnamed protein product [Fusarium equiseti]|uniref:Uncharacterized protein n=1 Tax=Fusarium equiseti TaxID=61235 RepID=A0A8J2ISP5_FUSEQ|nr:unnamed protein product [Fusarium equiseti]
MAPSSQFTIVGGHPFLSPGTVVSVPRGNSKNVTIVSGGSLLCPPGTVLSAVTAEVIFRPAAEKEKKKKRKNKKKSKKEKKDKEAKEEKKDEAEEEEEKEKEE